MVLASMGKYQYFILHKIFNTVEFHLKRHNFLTTSMSIMLQYACKAQKTIEFKSEKWNRILHNFIYFARFCLNLNICVSKATYQTDKTYSMWNDSDRKVLHEQFFFYSPFYGPHKHFTVVYTCERNIINIL